MSFCLLYLSSFTYLFISTEDPVNSKQILFTAGMIGDYSGLSTLYVCIYIYMYIYIYIYIKQSNESKISPIKPTGVTRIQAWIRRVSRNNEYVQVKSSKSRADGKNTN